MSLEKVDGNSKFNLNFAEKVFYGCLRKFLPFFSLLFSNFSLSFRQFSSDLQRHNSCADNSELEPESFSKSDSRWEPG